MNTTSGYNNENGDGLNCGPRARSIKNHKVFTPITIAVKGQLMASRRRQRRLQIESNTTFNKTYTDANFFIILIYSEDKSIKYNVWASTQNRNKKLSRNLKSALFFFSFLFGQCFLDVNFRCFFHYLVFLIYLYIYI